MFGLVYGFFIMLKWDWVGVGDSVRGDGNILLLYLFLFKFILLK